MPYKAKTGGFSGAIFALLTTFFKKVHILPFVPPPLNFGCLKRSTFSISYPPQVWVTLRPCAIAWALKLVNKRAFAQVKCRRVWPVAHVFLVFIFLFNKIAVSTTETSVTTRLLRRRRFLYTTHVTSCKRSTCIRSHRVVRSW